MKYHGVGTVKRTKKPIMLQTKRMKSVMLNSIIRAGVKQLVAIIDGNIILTNGQYFT